MTTPYKPGDDVYAVGRVHKGGKAGAHRYMYLRDSLEYLGFAICEFVDDKSNVHRILLRLDALYPTKASADRAANIAQAIQDKRKKRAKRVTHKTWGKDANNYAFGNFGVKTVNYA